MNNSKKVFLSATEVATLIGKNPYEKPEKALIESWRRNEPYQFSQACLRNAYFLKDAYKWVDRSVISEPKSVLEMNKYDNEVKRFQKQIIPQVQTTLSSPETIVKQHAETQQDSKA